MDGSCCSRGPVPCGGASPDHGQESRSCLASVLEGGAAKFRSAQQKTNPPAKHAGHVAHRPGSFLCIGDVYVGSALTDSVRRRRRVLVWHARTGRRRTGRQHAQAFFVRHTKYVARRSHTRQHHADHQQPPGRQHARAQLRRRIHHTSSTAAGQPVWRQGAGTEAGRLLVRRRIRQRTRPRRVWSDGTGARRGHRHGAVVRLLLREAGEQQHTRPCSARTQHGRRLLVWEARRERAQYGRRLLVRQAR